jgi:hypothetical protein
MESNNVITFPKASKVAPPITREQISNNMDLIRHVHVGETLSTIAPMLFEQLSLAGFDFTEDSEDLKYGAFIVESIRSMLMRSYDMPHPFQELAGAVFQEDAETGGLRIVEELNIKFASKFEFDGPEEDIEEEE